MSTGVIDLRIGPITPIVLRPTIQPIKLTAAPSRIVLRVAPQPIKLNVTPQPVRLRMTGVGAQGPRGVQGPEGPQGPAGPAGATSDGSVQVTWDTPAAESADSIAISGTVTDANDDPVLSAVDFQVIVTDGAADGEPSSTATIMAGASGTILAGGGTASAVIRTDTGEFAIVVNETAAGHRYLWVSGAGHERKLVRAADGVQELIFV